MESNLKKSNKDIEDIWRAIIDINIRFDRIDHILDQYNMMNTRVYLDGISREGTRKWLAKKHGIKLEEIT